VALSAWEIINSTWFIRKDVCNEGKADMKAGMLSLLFSVLGFLSVPIFFAAQSSIIAFQSKLHRTEQVFGQDGTLEEERVTDITYIRSSEGSIYQSQQGVDSLTGNALNRFMMITNVREKVIYTINPDKKQVLITTNWTPQVGQIPTKSAVPPNVETKTYVGRICGILNIENSGEYWLDYELGLPLYIRNQWTLPDGKKRVLIQETKEMMVGQEPDSKLFTPPSFDGYEIKEVQHQ